MVAVVARIWWEGLVEGGWEGLGVAGERHGGCGDGGGAKNGGRGRRWWC